MPNAGARRDPPAIKKVRNLHRPEIDPQPCITTRLGLMSELDPEVSNRVIRRGGGRNDGGVHRLRKSRPPLLRWKAVFSGPVGHPWRAISEFATHGSKQNRSRAFDAESLG